MGKLKCLNALFLQIILLVERVEVEKINSD